MEFNAVTAEDWSKSVRKVFPAVVVLRTTATRTFDSYSASVGSATGFVVDKRRGFILTNRHVVRPGKLALSYFNFSLSSFSFALTIFLLQDLLLLTPGFRAVKRFRFILFTEIQ
ncbi:unnamed protein product [Trifolium pratense]|uniref:Uncharacterized protein n=1 Tax=Trifolium pratense TaxID=57577 RepID=A0ACB0J9H9_TRIPR|nr:unnamed protein product [Trifolium pratense]